MRDPRRIRIKSSNQAGNKLVPELSITTWLIIINVLFFLFSYFLLKFVSIDYLDYLALNPSLFIKGEHLWTIITSMFMHGSIPHLLINMFVLFSLGSLCEKIIGKKRFLWFYLISGIIAGLFFVFLAYFFGSSNLGAAIFGGKESYAVGASGAIFAVAGLFVILTPRLKFTIIFFPFFSLPAYIMIPLVLFLTWLFSSSVAFAAGAEGGIGNAAHFGGFVAGAIYGIYLRKKYKRKTKMIERYFS